MTLISSMTDAQAALGAANTFTKAPQTINIDAAGSIGLVIKGAVGQTASLQEWQNSAGSKVGAVTVDVMEHSLLRSTTGAAGSGTHLRLQPSADVVVASIRGGSGQTANLLNFEDNAAAIHLSVTAGGLPKWTAAGDQQTTVGAAGAASALPANPTKYMKIVDSAGTTLVVPAYAAA